MKLKYITLVSFVLFVGSFVLLAFWNPFANISSPLAGTIGGEQMQKIGTIPEIPKNELTIEAIAKHATPSDCYLIVNGDVYNVSSYINQHPGGVRNITSRCGTEASKAFSAIHSNFAWNLLKKYYIGNVATAGSTNNVSDANIDTTSPNILENINSMLQGEYKGAEIIEVKPKKDFYVAKIIKDNKLYEIHINEKGEIIKEEIENDELDWSNWDEDEESELGEEYEDD